MKEFLYILAIIGVIMLGLWYQATVWQECRETNSFLYCMRLVGR